MSYCKKMDKDKVIFLTEEDQKIPSKTKVELKLDDDDHGLIRPDGSINWACPCLGGMATGPCSTEFRASFTCFHESADENKGAECIEKFQQMQQCMDKYPDLYGDYNKADEDGDEEVDAASEDNSDLVEEEHKTPVSTAS